MDWPTVLAQLDIPEWQKEPLIVADQVESSFGTRYFRIPHVESREGYYDMVAFIRTASNPRLQSRLERAISDGPCSISTELASSIGFQAFG